jgi:hypothetical protein
MTASSDGVAAVCHDAQKVHSVARMMDSVLIVSNLTDRVDTRSTARSPL